MSTIKVDTIATRTGSGNITLSNNVASLTSAGAISGTNLTASGTLGVTGATTLNGNIVLDNEDTTLSGGEVLGKIEFKDNDGGSSAAGITSKMESLAIGDFGASALTFHTSTSGGGGRTALTERFRIQHNGGVTFNGDTADANALDDYEEGTFTPTLVNDGSSTYSQRQGHYIKIGNMVTIQTKTTINTRSGGSGTTGIMNLPFAIRAGSPSQQTFHIVGNNSWDTNYGSSNITGYASNGGTTILFYYNSGSNLNGISVGDIGSNGEVYVAGSYITS